MPPKPKVNRYISEKRRASQIFVDRIEPQKAFWEAVGRLQTEQNFQLMTFYGAGGQGKTALCNELLKKTQNESAKNLNIISARIDLHTNPPKGRIHALVTLRNAIAQSCSAKFPCFDLAYADYWTQTNPDKLPAILGSKSVAVSQTDIETYGGELVSDLANLGVEKIGGTIGDILTESLSSIPLLGPVLRRTSKWAITQGYDRHLKKNSRALESLYSQNRRPDPTIILEALPDILAHELSLYQRANPGQNLVLFIDEYEAAMPNGGVEHSFRSDPWDTTLREFIKCCTGGEHTSVVDRDPYPYDVGFLLVVFGREKLNWTSVEDGWEDDLHQDAQHLIGGLGVTDAQEYLTLAGVRESSLCSEIIAATAVVERSGDRQTIYPLMLDLSVQIYFDLLSSGKHPTAIDFALKSRTYEAKRVELFQRFMRNYRNVPGLESMLRRLACSGTFTRELIQEISRKFHIPIDSLLFDSLLELSFVAKEKTSEEWVMHEHLSDVLVSTLSKNDKARTHTVLANWHHAASKTVEFKSYTVEHAVAYGRYLHHKSSAGQKVTFADISTLEYFYKKRAFSEATLSGVKSAQTGFDKLGLDGTEQYLLLDLATFFVSLQWENSATSQKLAGEICQAIQSALEIVPSIWMNIALFLQARTHIKNLQDGKTVSVSEAKKALKDLETAKVGFELEPKSILFLKAELSFSQGVIHFHLQSYSDSLASFVHYLDIIEPVVPSGHPDVARGNNNIAIVTEYLLTNGYVARVEKRARDIFAKTCDGSGVPLELKPAVFKSLPAPEQLTITEAEAYLSIAIDAHGESHPDSAAIKNLQSEIDSLGKQEFLETLESARSDIVKAYRNSYPSDDPRLADMLRFHYNAKVDVGMSEGATDLLDEAWSIYNNDPGSYREEMQLLAYGNATRDDIASRKDVLSYVYSGIAIGIADPLQLGTIKRTIRSVSELPKRVENFELSQVTTDLVSLAVQIFTTTDSDDLDNFLGKELEELTTFIENTNCLFSNESVFDNWARMHIHHSLVKFEQSKMFDPNHLEIVHGHMSKREATCSYGMRIMEGFAPIIKNDLLAHFLALSHAWNYALSAVQGDESEEYFDAFGLRLSEAMESEKIRKMVVHPSSTAILLTAFNVLRQSEAGKEIVKFADEYLCEVVAITATIAGPYYTKLEKYAFIDVPPDYKGGEPDLIIELRPCSRTLGYFTPVHERGTKWDTIDGNTQTSIRLQRLSGFMSQGQRRAA